jgi:hypothetical protein
LLVAGELVDALQVDAQRLADIADRGTRTIADHRRRQRGTVAPVLLVDVLHHFFASLVLEVDVDVGRLVSLLADEAFEQHAGPRGIDFCDAEAVAHRGVGCGAASLTQDALRCEHGARCPRP